MSRTMVLVTGAGRSGTSTAAGTLSHLGVHVPGPFLKANQSNPKGFYESRWSVQFHNRLLARADVAIADGRPEAAALVDAAIRDRERTRLHDWMEGATEGHPLTALKDPRTTWTLGLWSETADDLGIAMRFLTMLRHPAEVVGSRETYYAARSGASDRRAFAVKNLAGWVNAMLLTEERTRGRRRAIVRYDDLLNDWRPAVAASAQALGIDLTPDAAAAAAVDEFIDPDLSRHRLTWDDVDVPRPLRDLAQEVWEACDRLVDAGGSDTPAEARLDEARSTYAAMYLDAQQLAHDTVVAAANKARAEAAGERREQQSPGPDEGKAPAAPSGGGAGHALTRLRRRLARTSRGSR